MKIEKYRVGSSSLSSLLMIYFRNFEVLDPNLRNYIQLRYQVLVSEKALWTVKLTENGVELGSAVLCERRLMNDMTPLRLCFFSQIWINPRYRRMGYLKYLMKGLEEIEEEIAADASIVIARKAVGELYSKYGFVGFSKFPSVDVLPTTTKFSNFDKLKLEPSLLQSAYVCTYRAQNFYFDRSENFWRASLNAMRSEFISVFGHRIDGVFFYWIVSKGEVVELGCEKGLHWDEVVKFIISKGFFVFKIGELHPGFNSLLKCQGQFNSRPEPRAGHMIRFKESKSSKDTLGNSIEKLSTLVSKLQLDIPLVDQW